MRVPVLTYHAQNIAGNDYAGNDLVAFGEDLRLIDDLGLRIVPLQSVVARLLGRSDKDLTGCVALSCDDGTDFDVRDLRDPTWGPQRSLKGRMDDFIAERGADAQPGLHLTAFVIASPMARTDIDAQCLSGQGWMSEDWWAQAASSGRFAIENHSWDHNHDAIRFPGIAGMARGDFHQVDDRERARAEVADAARYIDQRTAPRRTSLFCYPFGHVPDYLLREYFPRHGDEHGMLAAVSDGACPVTPASDRWLLPRYIRGWHWKSPQDLEAILRDATGR